MRPVCTAEEMRAVDAEALAHVGIDELVERAGYALASEALRMLGGSYGRRIVVVAGKGHNGDDGRVAARVLARRGASVRVVPVAEAPSALPPCDLVVDAAFGTGFRGSYDAPTPPLGAFVLAADVPTGVDANTGRAGPRSVQADVTVTFGALKPGLLLGAGRRRAGEVVVRRIGLPVGNPPQHLVEDADLALLPARRPEGHKWDAAVYVAAGSPGMLGAAELATRGAARAGAGMVRLGSPGVAPGTVPVTEAVARHLPASDWAVPLLDDLSRCRALVLGPGLGSSSETVAAVRRLVVGAAVPLVLDADGLNALGTLDEAVRLLSARRAPLVMTPHDGEYARLVGTRPGEDRIAAARDLARRAHATVLLKGWTTVVASPSGSVLLVTSGSARLSTAGTGDVLSGIIGAFLARGVDPLLAAALAAHAHGRAATLGPADGLVAGDLPPLVAAVLGGARHAGAANG